MVSLIQYYYHIPKINYHRNFIVKMKIVITNVLFILLHYICHIIDNFNDSVYVEVLISIDKKLNQVILDFLIRNEIYSILIIQI